MTVLALTPNSAASLRVLQCVAATGLPCVVSSTSRAVSTFNGGAPRGKSRSIPASSTIRTRCARLTLVSFDRTSFVNLVRSSSVNMISWATRTRPLHAVPQ
ncbi:hypothetical protein K2O51_04910 [Cupriavidus pinatubonensis]|nr:hypothetical protein [Cupriavidus pinatubonensis]QYY29535.1 hypothetical protein K2O51_04910 [Cupriavidus pinatubonensis]TPQ40499.1 hypothetical protein C2U69_09710 [Cupriavidus pinatubonensis]